MQKQTIGHYKSRRNHVGLFQTDGGRVVRKVFREEAAFQKELQVYRLLQDTPVPCAKLLAANPKTLVLSQLPGTDLVQCLQQQEDAGAPVWDVWEKLVDWLLLLRQHTGFIMTDVNLRNFVYDEKTKILYGLDFEQCEQGSLELCAASLAAFIRTYRPENTTLKQAISAFVLDRFAEKTQMEPEALRGLSAQQEAAIIQRRKNKK